MITITPEHTARRRAYETAIVNGIGIGAVCRRDLTESDRDGLRIDVLLGNEENCFESVDVIVPRLRSVDSAVVERAVIRRAGNHPRKCRLTSLAASGPIYLRSDEIAS